MAKLEKTLCVTWTDEEKTAFRKTFKTFYDTAHDVSLKTGRYYSMRDLVNLFMTTVAIDRDDNIVFYNELSFTMEDV